MKIGNGRMYGVLFEALFLWSSEGLVSMCVCIEAEEHTTPTHTGQGRLVVFTDSYTSAQHRDLLKEQREILLYLILFISLERTFCNQWLPSLFIKICNISMQITEIAVLTQCNLM